MRIEITRDKVTGFPCVRRHGMPGFAALLPVTKLQAEEWIWREGIADPDDHDGVEGLVKRLEVRPMGECDPFRPAVRSLERLPLGELESRTALSVLASNLSLWTSHEQISNLQTFPTDTSEWGRLLRWLKGRVPHYQEWCRTQDAFGPVRTQGLLQQVLERHYEWPPAVERLLRKMKEIISRDARGLPFMGRGLYELIADTELIERLIGGRRKEARPQVAGDSPIWPFLKTTAGTGWWPLRGRVLPMVAVRPWFGEQEVGESHTLELAAEQRPEAYPPSSSGGRTAIRRVPLKPYVKTDDRMRHRCPNCHETVDAKTFDSSPTFDCINTRVADAANGTVKFVREHKYVKDSQGVIIPKAYLDVARVHPESIHTVAVAGYTYAGKTTSLLSLGGLSDYPDGRSVIYSSLPRSWGFVKRSLAIHDLRSGSGPIDRRKATEALWFDGALPIRTEKYGEALRDPVLFRSKPGWRQREVVLILDDMAGEAISDPKMVTNENFPHFASLADVIYIVPAEDMSAAIMEEFVSRLEQANTEGVPIDLSRTNLIFVISKIDELKHGIPAEKDLFARILPHPDRYRLPQHGDRAELKAYIEEMEEVHHRIEDWLRTHKPEFFQFFKLFGSLRCCGISALGVQPTKAPQGSDYEFTLAFRPEPVRAVDPLFWLLKENGLIHF